jgi:hypothetical protein
VSARATNSRHGLVVRTEHRTPTGKVAGSEVRGAWLISVLIKTLASTKVQNAIADITAGRSSPYLRSRRTLDRIRRRIYRRFIKAPSLHQHLRSSSSSLLRQRRRDAPHATPGAGALWSPLLSDSLLHVSLESPDDSHCSTS